MFSAGSPLGLRAPNLRQGVIDSLDSLHLIRGVGAFHAAKSRVDTREAERPPALPAYFSIAALRLVISRMIFGSNFARRS